MNIFVGNLPHAASEEDLRKAFEPFGVVAKVSILTDKFTGAPRGFGFVEMNSKQEAEAAINGLNGKDFMGRALNIWYSIYFGVHCLCAKCMVVFTATNSLYHGASAWCYYQLVCTQIWICKF